MSRPEKPIDWKLVDELLIAGCMGTEIAPHFDMHYETLYRRVEEKFGIGFTEYSRQKRAQGDACLRKVQYDKAMGGDNTLLVWLGKNRLAQKESHQEVSISAETLSGVGAVMSQIAEARLERQARKIEDKSSKAE